MQDRLRLLLPKVETLTWVDLIADALHEVLVRNFTITIFIEEAKDDVHLLIVQWQTPMLKEVIKLLSVDVWIVVLVKVLERLSHRAPLLPDLIDQFDQNVTMG